MDPRGWLSQHRDQALAAGLAGLYVAEVLLSRAVSGHRGPPALVAAVFAATLVVRRTLPLLLLLEAAVVIQLNHTVLPGIAEGGAFMITFLISVFSAGSYLRGRLLALAA